MAGVSYDRVEQTAATDTTAGSPAVGGGRRREVAGAVSLLFVFGILPLAVYFGVVRHPFTPKQVVCGSRKVSMLEYQDFGSKASGAQSLFTIDRVSSQAFPFWLAKLIDTIWDLFVARGVQVVASALSYVVLSNALLGTIRLSPVPYRTFSAISINGPSIATVVALLRDLGRHSRRRAVFLFAYSALAIVYVLAMPTLLSTLAGYISTASAYVQVPDTNQYVPNSAFVPGFYYDGLPGVENGTCISYKDAAATNNRASTQLNTCNSTCWTTDPNTKDGKYGYWDYLREHHTVEGCTFSRNETYEVAELAYDEFGASWGEPTGTATYNCNDTVTIDYASMSDAFLAALTNLTRETFNKFRSGTYCYGGRAYDDTAINANTECLPEVGAAGNSSSYRWGFSSMLSSIVLIV
ncbi:hypothetical protein UCDDS831_g04976 [Diplodia seriata]|uniref:Uncharacterized protein n=1 Tax=Diplodia seriata TaxID=420778 RepID=A0A0G2GTR5_9PEZI|nr:hypothetical protein UCDDS831_g04976 [Diplodia seriata]